MDVPIVVRSDAMRTLLAMVDRVANGPASVLISGETGTGKEVVARAIHARSLRANKPWVDINCAALPEHLVESELFGYEKGAFSGADAVKPGMFELANEGTLFLDEVGELEPKIQVKLLRVLDGAPYYRLGGSRKVTFDVRIIAATNQPLDEAVKSGRFRSDLFHRLSQIQLRVPPLRERPEDVSALTDFYLQQVRSGARISTEAREALLAYSWPGNIRELRNVISQAATLAEHDVIEAADLPQEIMSAHRPPVVAPAANLDEVERDAILRTLQECGGHQGHTATRLGISRRTLSRKLKQFRIEEGPAETAPVLAPPLGKLSSEQHGCFRASVELPVRVHADSGVFSVKSLNISLGGIAVDGITEPHRLSGELKLEFHLPAGFGPIIARARMVWADTHGKAGVRFTDLAGDGRGVLNRWLNEVERQEGWAVDESARS